MACQEEEKKPEYLWEEERFIEVLTEFQTAEGLVRLGYHKMEDSMYVDDSIYYALFQKMGVHEAEFDSNFSYYMQDPKKMEAIYEEVITRLSTKAAELNSAQPKKNRKNQKKKKKNQKKKKKKATPQADSSFRPETQPPDQTE